MRVITFSTADRNGVIGARCEACERMAAFLVWWKTSPHQSDDVPMRLCDDHTEHARANGPAMVQLAANKLAHREGRPADDDLFHGGSKS
jgi:hypothetical protein